MFNYKNVRNHISSLKLEQKLKGVMFSCPYPNFPKQTKVILLAKKVNNATWLYSCRGVLVITAENVIQQSLTSDSTWFQILVAICQRHVTVTDIQHWSWLELKLNFCHQSNILQKKKHQHYHLHRSVDWFRNWRCSNSWYLTNGFFVRWCTYIERAFPY